MLIVPNTEIKYRQLEDKSWETQWEAGEVWYFTFRNEREIKELHPDIIWINI